MRNKKIHTATFQMKKQAQEWVTKLDHSIFGSINHRVNTQ
jgi:hypothetical protein